MRRRALLTSIIAASAGCASIGEPTATNRTTEPPSDRTTAEQPTGTPPAGPDRFTSVVDLQTGSRTYAYAPTRMRTDQGLVARLWFQRTATADGPAVVGGWLANRAEYDVTVPTRTVPVVGDPDGRARDVDAETDTLYLAPTPDHALATTVPEVERGPDGFWRARELGDWYPDRLSLDSGEWVRLAAAVVGGPAATGRPPGRYVFRRADPRVRLAVWPTDTPGPTADSRFADRSVPSVGEQTVWFHEADRTTPVFVRPTRERLTLDGRVRFRAINHSHQRVGCGHWNLYKLVDDRWFHVDPIVHTADCRQLLPGEQVEWSLRAFNGRPVACECDGLTRGWLGGGLYAVVSGYGESGTGALVELVGDPVELRPTPDATVEREGATARVTTERFDDGSDPPDARLVVTRAETADERLIVEQLYRDHPFGTNRALRNGVAVMEPSLDRVVVRTDERAVDGAIGSQAETRHVGVRNTAYELARG